MKPELRIVWMVFLLSALLAKAEAATWYVRTDGIGSGTGWADALQSVQEAIDSATSGDEIWVAIWMRINKRKYSVDIRT